jgi:hypothetical protein
MRRECALHKRLRHNRRRAVPPCQRRQV